MSIPRALSRSFHALGAFAVTGALVACGGGQTLPPPAAPGSTAVVAQPGPADLQGTPAPDAVLVRFIPEDSDQHWTLLSRDNKAVCELPCARWISPGSGMALERERHGATNVERLSVPADFGAPAGATVDATARAPRSGRAGRMLEGGALIAAVGGVTTYALISNRGGDSVAIVLTSLVGVTLGLLVAGIYLTSTSHPTDVVLRTSSPPRATVAVGPGFLDVRARSSAESASTALHFVLTPLGAAGTF